MTGTKLLNEAIDLRVASPAAEPPPKRRLPLVDQLLREQRELTAVERFAQQHADAQKPLLEPYYRALLPAAPPGPGQQYAFEVDLDACTGCKACVTACHRLNGLDEGETWRSVGLLHGGAADAPVQKTVTTACHHCLDPACMKGCPVNAYEKDPVTGIVRHLDDQCFGCQYCTLTCPYEVPQYSAKKGIVRKCDMCSGRLAEGEAPACVQACPNGAIAIRVVEAKQVLEDAQADAFLPGAPSPGITAPTTVYKTKEALPRNLLPADFYAVRPSHQHMPLVVMLVLTQMSVGALLVERLASAAVSEAMLGTLRPWLAALALAMSLMAFAGSTLHLGRPLYAFRALLGLRTSWMSREIAAFSLFAAASAGYALSMAPAAWLPAALAPRLRAAAPWLSAASVGLGLFAVFCSVMLYVVTQRAWWSVGRTSFKFFGTTVLLGVGVLWVTMVAALSGHPRLPEVADITMWILFGLAAAKLAGELSVLLHLRDKRHGELKRSALLMVSHLARLSRRRTILTGVGAVLSPVACHAALVQGSSGWAVAWACVGLVALVAGELLERVTFFAAASGPRMPGGFG